MRTIFLLALILLYLSCSRDSGSSAAGLNILFVGHSQVNHRMPGYFSWLLESVGNSQSVGRQVIGGGNLEENYVLHAQTSDTRDASVDPDSKYLYFDGRISNKGSDSLAEIAVGNVAHLVITEEHGLAQAQARDTTFQSEHSFSFPSAENVSTSGDAYLLSTFQRTYGIGSGLGYYHQAVSNNADAKVYLYENFFPVVNGQTHCNRLNASSPTKTLAEINSWRKRIFSYSSAWTAFASEINSSRGQTVAGFTYGETSIGQTTIANGSAVELIPVAQALSVLVERICAGSIDGLTNPNELFMDHVHASQLGDYFVSLVMYSSIYDQSPATITLSGEGSSRALDGTDLLTPNSTLQSALASVAFEVVSGTATANNSDIATCTDLSSTSLSEEQLCIDSEDDETIPSY